MVRKVGAHHGCAFFFQLCYNIYFQGFHFFFRLPVSRFAWRANFVNKWADFVARLSSFYEIEKKHFPILNVPIYCAAFPHFIRSTPKRIIQSIRQSTSIRLHLPRRWNHFISVVARRTVNDWTLTNYPITVICFAARISIDFQRRTLNTATKFIGKCIFMSSNECESIYASNHIIEGDRGSLFNYR